MLFLLFVFGLFFGSFLNVIIDRIPREESFLSGRSYCEHCKHTLAWHDLIPVFSYTFLIGRCRYCHKKLSLYYPLLELITGIIFIFTYVFLPGGNERGIFDMLFIAHLLYFLLLMSGLLVIFFIDLKSGIIPFSILLPLTILVLCSILSTQFYLLPVNVLSAIGASAFFYLLHVLTKGRGMGFGDVVYVFFMGLLLGFPGIVIGLYIAFITGAIISILLLVLRKKKLQGSTVPFGPFLVLGTIVVLFFSQQLATIIHHYIFF